MAEIKRSTDCMYNSDDEMFYCDCNSEQDERFPTLAFLAGSYK